VLTPARAAAIACLALAAATLGLVLLRAPAATYTLRFQNASQLVRGNKVEIGGRQVGTVKSIRLSDDNEALVKITVERRYVPLHRGTTAFVRVAALAGVASRYVALNPGPQSAPELAPGTEIGTDRTTSAIELDQLFDTLDPRTRAGLTKVVRGASTAFGGHEASTDRVLTYLDPALSRTSALLAGLTADDDALSGLIADAADVAGALDERRGALVASIAQTATVADAVGGQDAALRASLRALPPTLRAARAGLSALTTTTAALDPLLARAPAATAALDPFLEQLEGTLVTARPVLSDLASALTDVPAALRAAPALGRAAASALPALGRASEGAAPILREWSAYAPELSGLATGAAGVTANYDANGHYARVAPQLNDFAPGDDGTLTALPPSARRAGLTDGAVARCPGAAAAPPPDGSAPVRVPGCDPDLVPPGP
jgi:phospholipid/cholesterol/gamma-HCH transport system substrate-binding protein